MNIFQRLLKGQPRKAFGARRVRRQGLRPGVCFLVFFWLTLRTLKFLNFYMKYE